MFARTATRRLAASNPAQKRFAHTSYGPEEPLAPYLKWVGVVGACIGLVTYDRFYSDRVLTRLLTPEDKSTENQEETFKFIEQQWANQQRPIAFFDSRKRSTHMETFSSAPVPLGGVRADHSSDVVDASQIGERRARSSGN